MPTAVVPCGCTVRLARLGSYRTCSRLVGVLARGQCLSDADSADAGLSRRRLCPWQGSGRCVTGSCRLPRYLPQADQKEFADGRLAAKPIPLGENRLRPHIHSTEDSGREGRRKSRDPLLPCQSETARRVRDRSARSCRPSMTTATSSVCATRTGSLSFRTACHGNVTNLG